MTASTWQHHSVRIPTNQCFFHIFTHTWKSSEVRLIRVKGHQTYQLFMRHITVCSRFLTPVSGCCWNMTERHQRTSEVDNLLREAQLSLFFVQLKLSSMFSISNLSSTFCLCFLLLNFYSYTIKTSCLTGTCMNHMFREWFSDIR